jgi:Ca2+-transporting ATPase
MTTNWHTLTSAECATNLDTDINKGLSKQEASRRLISHGENALEQADTQPWWQLLISQFQDFMIVVLLVAAVISGIIGEATDALIILIIVVLNALLGAYQALRAEKAMAALRAMASHESYVLRDGHWSFIASSQIVSGDVIKLDAGNIIPADIRLTNGKDVEVDESSLTGESVGVSKHIDALKGQVFSTADQINMLFKGTQINRGSVVGIVVATGMQTQLGKIASLLKNALERQTPLQDRLEAFGKRLAISILFVCLVVFSLGVARGEPWLLMLLTGISLAVAAIPEALPAVVSIALALGAAKMSRSNALMRNLPAVETLGSVTYICSDKTGTLTQNKMHADKFITPDSFPGTLPNALVAQVLGEGHRPHLCFALALNNDVLTNEGKLEGEPTELALCQAALDQGFNKLQLESSMPRLAEFAFDSTRKRMTTLHALEGSAVSYTKGAPESVIARCTSHLVNSKPDRATFKAEQWITASEDLASQGYRVLALAMRHFPDAKAAATDKEALESELTFLGLIALIDPPREEAKVAVAQCITAGITPVMITGDHPATACAIAEQIGLIETPTHSDRSGPKKPAIVMTGQEMTIISDSDLQIAVKTIRVYARVSPEQKVRLVQALQNNGEFCAMTGDGVNDAPALKNAHIGIAMGKNGTDVAREASDMILLDDNFATIVTAVKQGRRIFDNIRKFIKYTMTSNSGEIWVLLLAPLLGMPIPLLPIHILWINLVTDGLPGLALSFEPAEKGLMSRPPRSPNESIFAHGMWQHIIYLGLCIGGISLFAQYWALENSPLHWQTMVFTTLTLAQLVNVLMIRAERESIFRLNFFSNKPLIIAVVVTILLQLCVIYLPFANELFKTSPLPPTELFICVALAGLILVVVEIEKMLVRKGFIYNDAN